MEYTKIPFDGYEYVSNITDNPWLMPYGMAIALTHAAHVTVCNGDNPDSHYKIIATLAPKIVYI